MSDGDGGRSANPFDAYRGHCFAVAYRMLGSVADAEDVVQEAWLRWRDHADAIATPRAWLTQVVSRLAIDRLRARQRSREDYVGPWLPEPLLDQPEDDPVERAESVRMAFLVVLEQLGPVERAVFLLRSVFERDYAEIAAITGKSVANCRQIFTRARQRIDDARPRFDVPRDRHLELLARFQIAAQTNDVDALVAALDPDAVLTSDGGGKIEAALKPLTGARKVARFLAGVAQIRSGVTSVRPTAINRQPGVLVYTDGVLDSAISFDIVDDRIARVHIVRNPDKLRHLS